MNTITRSVIRRGVSARVFFRSFCAKSNDLGAIPVNIMKNGEDLSGASGRVSEWVFQLHEDLPSLQDLQDKIAKGGI